jgi:hypothetical protein
MERGTRWTLHKKCGKLSRTIPDEFAFTCDYCRQELGEDRFIFRVSGEFGNWQSKGWKEHYEREAKDNKA